MIRRGHLTLVVSNGPVNPRKRRSDRRYDRLTRTVFNGRGERTILPAIAAAKPGGAA